MTRIAGARRRAVALATGFALGVAVLGAVSSPAGAVARTQNFQYTGGPQSLVVPPGVASVTFDVLGAGGGGGSRRRTIQGHDRRNPGRDHSRLRRGSGQQAAGSGGGFNGRR